MEWISEILGDVELSTVAFGIIALVIEVICVLAAVLWSNYNQDRKLDRILKDQGTIAKFLLKQYKDSAIVPPVQVTNNPPVIEPPAPKKKRELSQAQKDSLAKGRNLRKAVKAPAPPAVQANQADKSKSDNKVVAK